MRAAAVCLAAPPVEVEVAAASVLACWMVEEPTVVSKVEEPDVTVLTIAEVETAVELAPEPKRVVVSLSFETVVVGTAFASEV
jgi:hypothetical protein